MEGRRIPFTAPAESDRVAALHALAMLDSDPEGEFDALVALASELLGCATAMLNLVDRDRVWIKASTITGPREYPRDVSFCSTTIINDEMTVIDDTLADDRFRANPFVAETGVRFYAGAPVHVPDNNGVRRAIGTLCVVDHTPHVTDRRVLTVLAHLATLAEALLDARRTALKAIHIATTGEEMVTRLARQDHIFRQTEKIAMIGSWRLTVADQSLEWSDNVYRIHGLPVGQKPKLEEALRFYPAGERVRIAAMLEHAVATGEPFALETDFITADGKERRVRSMGDAEMVDGHVVAMVGVFQDITDRHALETKLRRSADTDALTGIANRAAFDRELQAAMDHSRVTGAPLHLALIDLDGFKAINDTLGHGAGDDVLRMTGAMLSEPWLRGSVAARIGGDEFALIITDPVLLRDPEALRDRIEAALCLPVEANGVTMTSSGSVGVAAFDDECHSLRDFARRADVILYDAKRARIGSRPRPRPRPRRVNVRAA